MEKGNIPVFMVEGETLPEVWERAVLKTWNEGIQIKTEYDRKEDPPSRDCTMIMVCQSPFKEPRIHRAFPGGLEDLEIYRQEVVNGVHDSWICPQEGKWSYTYHQRLFAFPYEGKIVDQINYICEKLSRAPYSRRGQAITWNPISDPATADPPCLQRIWCRIFNDEKGLPVLNMNTHWRSRDAYKASFMNIFALTDLQRCIAQNLSEKMGREISLGRYVDISDSFHIYGSYYEEFKGFLKTLEQRTFAQRTWDTKFGESFFAQARQRLEKEKDLK